MSQSHPGGSDNPVELDPLLAFNAELAVSESSEKPVIPPQPAAASQADESLPLRLRLDQAERSLDRARAEIATLKSNLVTLVGAVDDIKKRLGRRPEAVPAPAEPHVPQRRRVGRAAAMVLLVATVGVAIWGVASVVPIEMPEPPPVDSIQEQPRETESSVAPPVAPAPTADLPVPAVELQAATLVARVPRPAPPVVNREPTTYFGTLSIDASPAGEVFINRRSAGRTPVLAENLRAGSHLIWIEREGYRRWTRVVAVAADRVNRISANLDPLER